MNTALTQFFIWRKKKTNDVDQLNCVSFPFHRIMFFFACWIQWLNVCIELTTYQRYDIDTKFFKIWIANDMIDKFINHKIIIFNDIFFLVQNPFTLFSIPIAQQIDRWMHSGNTSTWISMNFSIHSGFSSFHTYRVENWISMMLLT